MSIELADKVREMLERISPILLVSHRPLFGQMGEFLLEIFHGLDVDQFLG